MTVPRPRRWRAGATALALVGLVGPACNDLPSSFEPLPPTHIQIIRGSCVNGASLRVIEGRKCEIEVEARDANSQVVIASFSWATGDQAIASVALKPGFDSTVAEVTGVTVGLTTLRVTVSGHPELAVERELTVLDSNNPDL